MSDARTAAAIINRANVPDVEAVAALKAPPERTGLSMAGDVMKMAVSRAIVVAISMATMPIVSRLFPPESFGVVSILTTLATVFAAFGSLNYIRAIPIAASDDERRNLCVLCLAIGAGATIVVAALTLAGADALARYYDEPDLTKYAWFLPLLFLGQAVWDLGNMTLGCERRFGAIAVRNVMEIIITRSVQLGSCLVGLLGSPLALLIAALAGRCASIGVVGVASIKRTIDLAEKPLSPSGIRAAAAKFRKFPLVSLWTATINALTLGLPVFILGMWFSMEVVGLYGMAYMLVNLPLNLFAAGINQIFHVEAGSRMAKGDSAADITRHLVRMVSLLTAFPLTVVLLLGPLLFEFFLGQRWYEAGVFAQILVPWLALRAFSSPLSAVFIISNRQGEHFLWSIALLVTRFSAIYFGGMYFGVRMTLMLYAVSNTLVIVGMTFRALGIFGLGRRWMAAHVAGSYAEPLLLLAPAGLVYWHFHSCFGAIVVLGIATIVHAALIYRRHPEVVNVLLARFGIPGFGRSESPDV